MQQHAPYSSFCDVRVVLAQSIQKRCNCRTIHEFVDKWSRGAADNEEVDGLGCAIKDRTPSIIPGTLLKRVTKCQVRVPLVKLCGVSHLLCGSHHECRKRGCITCIRAMQGVRTWWESSVFFGSGSFVPRDCKRMIVSAAHLLLYMLDLGLSSFALDNT